MGALIEYYVDPVGGDDAGAGTVGDPWKTIEYALGTGITRDATHGDRINIKSDQPIGVFGATADTLSASLNVTGSYGTPTEAAPLFFQGYSEAATDGGKGSINLDGNAMFAATTYDYIHIRDLKISGGATNPIYLDQRCSVIGCEVTDCSSGYLVRLNNYGMVLGNYIHDGTGSGGIRVAVDALAADNWVETVGTYGVAAVTGNAFRNVILQTVTGRYGLYLSQAWGDHNSIASTATSGTGIYTTSGRNYVTNNLIQGCRTAWHTGSASGETLTQAANSFHNCGALSLGLSELFDDRVLGDEEVAVPIFRDAASGDLRPRNVGSVYGPCWPEYWPGLGNYRNHLCRGAIQPDRFDEGLKRALLQT